MFNYIKKHLSIKLAVILFGMAAAIILFGILSNYLFMEKYYIGNKKDEMISIYSEINNVFANNSIQDRDTVQSLLIECENNSVSALVIDSSLMIKFSSGFSINGDNLIGRIKDIIFGGDKDLKENIEEYDKYSVYEINDGIQNRKYLEIYGVLDSGEIVLMRSSIDGIRRSIATTNKFYKNVIIVLFVISFVAIIFVVNNVTKIMKLENDINEKNKIDEMRKEFVSNVSHELKTPISIISGYAEGLKECVGDEESRDYYCDVIIDEADKMNKLVMKLLTLNQLEAGYSEIEMERFDIIDLIEQILSNFKQVFDSKDIKIVFDNSNPVYVWSDEFQIAEVITNYVSNAINHIDYDKIIYIGVSQEAEENKVKVTVANTGKNIDETDLLRIWDKFYKVDKARTREYGGNGIGLSIVKAIMERLSQKYGVVNKSENIVEFYFTVDSDNDIS